MLIYTAINLRVSFRKRYEPLIDRHKRFIYDSWSKKLGVLFNSCGESIMNRSMQDSKGTAPLVRALLKKHYESISHHKGARSTMVVSHERLWYIFSDLGTWNSSILDTSICFYPKFVACMSKIYGDWRYKVFWTIQYEVISTGLNCSEFKIWSVVFEIHSVQYFEHSITSKKNSWWSMYIISQF